MNKGFTLVELLAVIIILTLLALLTSTAVTKLVKDSKENLHDTQYEMIESAAETWGADNISKLPDTGKCGYLTLLDLKEYGLVDSSVLDPNTSSQISDNLKIKVSTTTSSYGRPTIKYEVTEDIDGCTKIYDTVCRAVTSATTGNVPTGKFLPGDEYTCEVKPGTSYTFFVLSTEGNKVNLIMDKNICGDNNFSTDSSSCIVPWISEEDYKEIKEIDEIRCDSSICTDEGPITAINYLNKVTSSWSNVENLNEIYNEENGIFKSFKLTGKARLPKYTEIINTGCTEESGSCLAWVSGNLNVVDSIFYGYGYWLQDVKSDKSLQPPWFVYLSNNLSSHISSSSLYNGIRPVITVSKYRIK